MVRDDMAYTALSSAACLVIDMPGDGLLETPVRTAGGYLLRRACIGSDPGVCVVWDAAARRSPPVAFGLDCARRKMS
jgi:hypothetical protein